jgi:hypothetical protein
MLVTGTILKNPAMTVAPVMYGILMLLPMFAYLGLRRCASWAALRRSSEAAGLVEATAARRRAALCFDAAQIGIHDIREQALENRGVPVADRRLGALAAHHRVVAQFEDQGVARTTRNLPEPAKVQACFR